MTLAPPVLCFAGGVLLGFFRTPTPAGNAKRRVTDPRRGQALLFSGVFVAILVVYFLAAPIENVTSDKFYAGHNTLRESVQSVVRPALLHSIDAPGLDPLLWIAAILGFASAAAALWLGWRRLQPHDAPAVAAWLSGMAVIGSGLMLLFLHSVAGMPYPIDRTGLYFIPLIALAAMALVQLTNRIAHVLTGLGAAFALVFVAQIQVSSFDVWRYDADTRRLLEQLELRKFDSGKPVSLGGSWQLEPALNFYQRTQNLTWLAPVDRQSMQQPSDYYALIAPDRPVAEAKGFSRLYEGPISGTALYSASSP
jgi:hypothetical protein